MLIKNNTDLSYEEIGKFIDRLINDSEGQTYYFGKVEVLYFNYRSNKYKVTITYLKSYVKYIIEEVNNG